MFTNEQRNDVRNRVLELARADSRVTAGALTGSTAVGATDEWSDIDLAFGIAESISVEAVLDDWTELFARIRRSPLLGPALRFQYISCISPAKHASGRPLVLAGRRFRAARSGIQTDLRRGREDESTGRAGCARLDWHGVATCASRALEGRSSM